MRAGSRGRGESVERGSRTLEKLADRTAAVILAPLRGIGEHELVSLFDGLDPLGQRRFFLVRHYRSFGCDRSSAGTGQRAGS